MYQVTEKGKVFLIEGDSIDEAIANAIEEFGQKVDLMSVKPYQSKIIEYYAIGLCVYGIHDVNEEDELVCECETYGHADKTVNDLNVKLMEVE